MKRYVCRRVFCTAAFFVCAALIAIVGSLFRPKVPLAGEGLDGALAAQLRTAWREGRQTIVLDSPLPLTVLTETYFAMRDASPELFWVSYRFAYTAEEANGLVQSVSPAYLCNADEVDRLSVSYAAALDALAERVSGETDAFRVARLLHDALAESVTYGRASASALGDAGQYTAYGALVEGRAVCRGYAMAYLDLLRYCGINAVYVRSETMNHGWVMACLEGAWVHIDVTRDDGDALSHRYFARSDIAMHLMGYTDWLIGIR